MIFANTISTPNENRTRVTRMKILGTNHYTMGAYNNINTIRILTYRKYNCIKRINIHY